MTRQFTDTDLEDLQFLVTKVKNELHEVMDNLNLTFKYKLEDIRDRVMTLENLIYGRDEE